MTEPSERRGCIVDPETFFYMTPSGQLHAHVFDNLTGRTKCAASGDCVVCLLPWDDCDCLRRRCPRCGSFDLREVIVDEQLEHVDVACIDCSWRERIGGGA